MARQAGGEAGQGRAAIATATAAPIATSGRRPILCSPVVRIHVDVHVWDPREPTWPIVHVVRWRALGKQQNIIQTTYL